MQFDISSIELRQYGLDAALNGRMIRAVTSDKLLDNGPEYRGRQKCMRNTHAVDVGRLGTVRRWLRKLYAESWDRMSSLGNPNAGGIDAFVAKIVPEPSTLVLSALGAAILWQRPRRRAGQRASARVRFRQGSHKKRPASHGDWSLE